MKRVVWVFVFACAASVCAAAGFSIDFTGCIESIGVGLVSTDAAQAYVPAGFVLAGAGFPVTAIVVRTSRCDGISVDAGRAQRGIVVQIGLVLVPPDFTGDINNYTLWYYTSDAKLARELQRAGVAAQWVPGLVDVYVPQVPGDPDPLAVLVPFVFIPLVPLPLIANWIYPHHPRIHFPPING